MWVCLYGVTNQYANSILCGLTFLYTSTLFMYYYSCIFTMLQLYVIDIAEISFCAFCPGSHHFPVVKSTAMDILV